MATPKTDKTDKKTTAAKKPAAKTTTAKKPAAKATAAKSTTAAKSAATAKTTATTKKPAASKATTASKAAAPKPAATAASKAKTTKSTAEVAGGVDERLDAMMQEIEALRAEINIMKQVKSSSSDRATTEKFFAEIDKIREQLFNCEDRLEELEYQVSEKEDF